MNERTCSINDCDAPVRARGWCNKHWQRWYNHGDPLFITPRSKPPCAVAGCPQPHYGVGLCAKHYTRLRRHGAVNGGTHRDLSPEERFWQKVAIADPDDCWEWTSHRQGPGYGRFWDGNASVLAPRWIWEHTIGPIPDGLLICHHCDNPPCVNTRHLFLGTYADNARDRVSKGRQGKRRTK